MARENQVNFGTVERIVEVPVMVEKIVNVPEIQQVARICEKIVEVPRVQIQEKIIEVPKVHTVEKRVDVPTIEVVEKQVEVPVVQVREKTVEVPVVQVREKTVEVPVAEVPLPIGPTWLPGSDPIDPPVGEPQISDEELGLSLESASASSAYSRSHGSEVPVVTLSQLEPGSATTSPGPWIGGYVFDHSPGEYSLGAELPDEAAVDLNFRRVCEMCQDSVGFTSIDGMCHSCEATSSRDHGLRDSVKVESFTVKFTDTASVLNRYMSQFRGKPMPKQIKCVNPIRGFCASLKNGYCCSKCHLSHCFGEACTHDLNKCPLQLHFAEGSTTLENAIDFLWRYTS